MEANLAKALKNMLKYTKKVAEFCEKVSYEQFENDELLIDACVMNLDRKSVV